MQTLRHTEFDVQDARSTRNSVTTHVHLTVLHAPAHVDLDETVRVLHAAVRCIGLSGRPCEQVRMYWLRTDAPKNPGRATRNA